MVRCYCVEGSEIGKLTCLPCLKAKLGMEDTPSVTVVDFNSGKVVGYIRGRGRRG